MNLWGFFQYRATKFHKNQSVGYNPTQRTIVMQAGHVKIDFCPRHDRERRLSTVGVGHCQRGIFRGYLRDVRCLMTVRDRWPRIVKHSIKRTGGLCTSR